MAKKSKKKKRIIVERIGMGVSILLLSISLIFLIMMFKMNVLPTKYLLLLLGIYLPVVLILLFLMLFKKIKVSIKIGAEVVASVIIIFMSIACFYIFKTMDFLGNIKDKKYQTENYYVLVLKDSKYDSLTDIKGKKVGTYPSQTGTYEAAIEALNKKVSTEKVEYKDFMKLGKDLLNKNQEIIFLSESHRSILEDEIEAFSTEVNSIGTISIKVKNETVKKEADVENQSFNIYISGIDTYGDISSISRSDVNIIATVNPVTHKILLTSIPRDYYVQLHGTTGYRDKLTHAGMYGVDMSIATIEDLLDIDINYYARVNFTTLVTLVDAIGGVTVDSEYAFRAITGEYFAKGENYLNGKEALVFARERHAFLEGDRQRGKNQQKIITAILNKALSSTTLITKYTNILKSLQNSFQTNMDSNSIYSLVNKQLETMPSWSIESISLDGYSSSNYTYTYGAQKLYVMEPDKDTVNSAKEKIKEISNSK